MQGAGKGYTVHQEITVFSYPERFILEPHQEENYSAKSKCLCIERQGGGVSFVDDVDPNLPPTRVLQCQGLIGVIQLLAGPYLIAITEKIPVGTIRGHPVYQISRVRFIPFVLNTSQLNERQKRHESTYISIIESLLQDKHFYFSYSLDLTTSLKRVHVKSAPNGTCSVPVTTSSRGLRHLATNKYFWNHQLLDYFRVHDLPWDRWFLPLIRGYVHISLWMVQSVPLDFVLISRRSSRRAGTRYLTRGVDQEGNVANYVETEQLVGQGLRWTSFVQTRGSIPLFWCQKTNLKYNPRTRITHTVYETERAFQTHFDSELSFHSRQLIVNLLDSKGSELRLSKLYRCYLRRIYEANPQIDYHEFDFHGECRNDQYDKVDELVQALRSRLDLIRFTEVSNGCLETIQYGTIRTNCLDCLDRTNLVQSKFARFMLSQQFEAFGVSTAFKKQGFLDRAFKEAWANNGDAISLQYAGTGALKSDFTRTGKRNTKGKFKDGVNAISRYVINNFHDSLRQIAIDLFLGTLQVEGIDLNQIEEEQRTCKRMEEDEEEEIEIEIANWNDVTDE